MQVGFIVILIIAIFVAIFAIQNGTPVPVDLFLARFEMPLAVVMMICLILGAVIVLVLGTTRQFKKRSETKEMKNKLKTLENDKTLIDNNIKALETEVTTLKDANNTLTSKIAELEELKTTNTKTIEMLNNELDLLKAEHNALIESNITNEGVELSINNENSEAQSEWLW